LAVAGADGLSGFGSVVSGVCGDAVFVVMVSSECAPVAPAGGLGDVVFGRDQHVVLLRRPVNTGVTSIHL